MPGAKLQRLIKPALALLLSLAMLAGALPAYAETVESVSVRSAPLTTKATALDGMVRVYLSSLGEPTTLTLTIAGNYSINGQTSRSLANGSTVTIGFSSSTGAITLTQNGQTTNMGRAFSLKRHSTTGENGIKIAQSRESNYPYPGDLSCTPSRMFSSRTTCTAWLRAKWATPPAWRRSSRRRSPRAPTPFA